MRMMAGRVSGIERPAICAVVGEGTPNPTRAWVIELKTAVQEAVFGQGVLRPASSIEKETRPILAIAMEGCPYSFETGDVVMIHPSGQVTVLYEANSESNALMLTGECDNRCIMCSQPPAANTPWYAAEATAVLEMIGAPPQVLGLTGGEPTLAWEELLGTIRRCRERFPSTVLQLLTNGRCFHDDILAKELAEAGGDHLVACVPLYADTDDLHDEIVGVHGAFWDTLQGLYNLERNGTSVELRIVILRQNFHRLKSWAEFVYRSLPFVEHVALMGLEPIGLALANLESVWIDPADYAGHLTAAVRHFQQCGMQASLFNHQLCTLPPALWKFARQSISSWKKIYLAACGDCAVKNDCGGFFASGREIHSRMVLPVDSQMLRALLL